MTFFLPRKSLSFTGFQSFASKVKSGATSPTFKFVLAMASSCAVAENCPASISSRRSPTTAVTILFIGYLLLSLQTTHHEYRRVSLFACNGVVNFAPERQHGFPCSWRVLSL